MMTTASLRGWRRLFAVEIVILIALEAADALSTALLLPHGYREANPMLAIHTWWGIAGFKGLDTLALLVALLVLWRLRFYRATPALLALGLPLLVVADLHNWLYVLGY